MASMSRAGQMQQPPRFEELLAKVRLVAFDFDGVLTDNTVQVSQDGIESVRCWRSDGLGLARLREIGVDALIVSTEVNPVVGVRASKLKVPWVQGVDDKRAAILKACAELHVDPCETAFVGNDINDVPAFQAIGVPIAVADAYPEVLPHTVYRTAKPGGYGAVREVCDLIFHARQRDPDTTRPDVT
jgi:3-deoxy-D-manno-octulosonate 8-phosphate phosphatase (KDO 8-P phosphatase)